MSAHAPAIYRYTVTHVRFRPFRRRFRHRGYTWLIDVDHPPRLPAALGPLARFDPRDHFAGTAPTLRAGVDRFLAAHGVDLAGGRVLMLAQARVLGHVFNPLSLYWCHEPDGDLRCVLAEVHNTYRQRHCYLLPATGRAVRQQKELYVSPFFGTGGGYLIRAPEPAATLDVAVVLQDDDGPLLTATMRGARRPAGARGLLAAAARHPLSTQRVSAAIRTHGARLFARGLPVLPRPDHQAQEGMR